MKESTRAFIRSVALTTGLAFTLITFFYMGLMAFAGDRSGGNTTVFTFFSYTLGKLFCIFLFSLSLGFLNRLFSLKKPRAFLRLVHLLGTALAYGVFLILMFYTMFDAASLNSRGILLNVVLFAVGYPLVLGIHALGKALFLPKEEKSFKSILD